MEGDIDLDLKKRWGVVVASPKRMAILAFILLIILASLVYIAFFNERVTVISFKTGCNETYINGKLSSNSSLCTAEREFLKQGGKMMVAIPEFKVITGSD